MQLNPELKSEVEKFQNILKVGDKINYSDGCNFMEYQITELFEDGIEVKALTDNCNIEKGKCEDLFFNELQKGWIIDEETKNLKTEFYAN